MYSDMIYRVMIEKAFFSYGSGIPKNYTYTKSKILRKWKQKEMVIQQVLPLQILQKSKRFYSETYFIGRNFI